MNGLTIHPPLTGGCWDCGRAWETPGWVDAWIPNDLWAQIAPIPRNGTDRSGHLCIHCITAALTRIGATDVPVEIWAGPYEKPSTLTTGSTLGSPSTSPGMEQS